MKCTIITLCSLLLIACAGPAQPDSASSSEIKNPKLGFEHNFELDAPDDWQTTNAGHIDLDRETFHSGTTSLKITRLIDEPTTFTAVSIKTPVSNTVKTITLKAKLKTSDVVQFASTYLRQDQGADRVAYANLQPNYIRGNQDWAEHTISVPRHPDATEISVGVFLSGGGTVWADDFEILFDGETQDAETVLAHKASILETDREFVESSGISTFALTPLQIENTAVFIKVWGFLKYHHPRVTEGNLHWDFELFRILPDMLSADTATQRNERLVEWVEGLGQIEECDPCAQIAGEAHLLPKLGWLSDTNLLGSELSENLQSIYSNRDAAASQFYLRKNQAGLTETGSDLPYETLESIDAGYRILAVARYWNLIHYAFPYSDMIDRDWDELLSLYVQAAVEAETREAYERVMMRLIAEVDDGHATITNRGKMYPPEGECDLPVDLRHVEGRPTVISIGAQASVSDLQVGDAILQIDGEQVDDLYARIRPYYGASNERSRFRMMNSNLLNGECGALSLQIDRAGETLSLSLNREKNQLAGGRRAKPFDRPGETLQILDGNISYLKLSSIQADEIDAYVDQIRDTDALIIDIRGYPGDNVMYELGQWFAIEPTPTITFTVPDQSNPGLFRWSNGPKMPPTKKGERLNLPFAILVNEATVSSAEFTAVTLQALPNSITVGSQTAGADGNVVNLALPGGLLTRFSGIGVFYPDRTPTQQVGVRIDIPVEPTRAGIIAGRDEILERAIEELEKMK